MTALTQKGQPPSGESNEDPPGRDQQRELSPCDRRRWTDTTETSSGPETSVAKMAGPCLPSLAESLVKTPCPMHDAPSRRLDQFSFRDRIAFEQPRGHQMNKLSRFE